MGANLTSLPTRGNAGLPRSIAKGPRWGASGKDDLVCEIARHIALTERAKRRARAARQAARRRK